MFNHLTDRGFFVTFGLNFGSDFLAYEKDPLLCHAKYLVKVLEGTTISTAELVLAERVANQAKKDLLLCYSSEKKE